MKKIKTLVVTILSVMMISYLTIKVIAFIENRQKLKRIASGVFKFDDYNDAKEAENFILKLHPIRSSVDGLVKTLESAGKSTKCFAPGFYMYTSLQNELGKLKYANLACNYKKLHSFIKLEHINWSVVVDYDKKSRNIKEMKVLRQIQAMKFIPDIIAPNTQIKIPTVKKGMLNDMSSEDAKLIIIKPESK